ncbi:MAG: hypothetical protein J6T71_03115 [Paludibacteraceae bacterium]|nr:hypothetical protein [Paludibacteraceae bacterium]
MKYKSILFVLVALLAVSCDMATVVSPRIVASNQLVRTSITGERDTILFSDSLNIGDTVQMGILLNGYYDYLVSFAATADTDKVHLSVAWPDSLGGTTDASDPEHAKLVFVPDSVYSCLTTLSYVPVSPGVHPINLVLTSAAKAPYSQSAAQFYIAVRKP